jgi:hypothetical protein
MNFRQFSKNFANLLGKYVAASKKGRSCQGVKYVFDAHTSKAGIKD